MPKRFLHARTTGKGTGKGTGKDTGRGTGKGPARGADTSDDRGTDRGQAAIEFAGLITLLLLVGLAAIQLGVAAYAVQQAGTASRAAARAASTLETDFKADYKYVGVSSMSDWLADDAVIEDATYSGDEVQVTARVPVPAILPVFDFPDARRSATMPLD